MYFPAFCLMVIIFLFSSQPGEESSAESSRIVGLVLYFFEYLRGMKFSQAQYVFWAEKIHTPVRKLAHMAEYAALAWSILIPVLSQYKECWQLRPKQKELCSSKTGVCRKGLWRLCLLSFLVTAVYAATDEFHQLFVEGRSGAVSDVFVDSAGACIGILGYLFLWKIVKMLFL